MDDDGSAESGYGWVPASVEGIYVQGYDGADFSSGALTSVCVCWIRTRADDDIRFDVVLYDSDGGEPATVPFAAIPAEASALPIGVPGATFVEVELRAVPIPEGEFFVGVRWNPSVDQYFFLCSDQTPRAEPPTRLFFRDDRFLGWGNAATTIDPLFAPHQAVMLRPVALPVDIPIGPAGSAALGVALLAAGWLAIRRA